MRSHPAIDYTTDYATWSDYGGSADAAQYSSLRHINRSNVHRLEVAWSYSTSDNNVYFFAPLVVDNVAYVLARNNSIVALDAVTGSEIWVHPAEEGMIAITNRGINDWESGDRSDRRLLYAADHFLRALDAKTGRLIVSFGEGGRVNLKEGLGRDPDSLSLVQSHSPGRVFEDLAFSVRQPMKDTARPPETSGPSTSAQEPWSGPSIPSHIPVSSDTTPGRRMPGRP